jgi:endonuclease/exonuclease/phosphatase family metal-dependent hydrolase
MTYNIGGGRKDLGSSFADVARIVAAAHPDVLAAQEATDFQDQRGAWQGPVHDLAAMGDFASNFSFGPTLSLSQDFDSRKAIMVEASFAGYRDWRQGNALYSRHGFCELRDPTKAGTPVSLSIYRPPVYQGNRDTDPRNVVLGRINLAPLYPYVLNTHLTTLLGERGSRAIPGKALEAELLRYAQVQRILDLIGREMLSRRLPVILVGDLNATADEICMSRLLSKDTGFVRLQPKQKSDSTHPKADSAIDHILVFPEELLHEYCCWVITGEDARQASDHAAVVADVIFKV